ncbi:hypothetical protein XENOCAPTIV_001700 [Xenoophorus captivus]|uniref:EGF-like domain-containing protein n=1 Tax=Xenoophorus captivus TaxID=1517983 RepID=A0ABV0QXY2_9TELE
MSATAGQRVEVREPRLTTALCGLLFLAGWTGLHCEDDINECLPQPCNQGICIQNDPGYGYTCFCRPGFVVSDLVFKCKRLLTTLPNQAVNTTLNLAFQRGVARHISRLSNLCTQGRNCEHNYDDCLLNPCPEAFSCVDGINKVSCLPPITDPVPLVTPSENITSGYTPRALMPSLSPSQIAELSTGMDRVVSSLKFLCVKIAM